MIHAIIGTKAQCIKMAPLLRYLKEAGIEHNLIDLGQHSLITRELRREFDLDEPGIYLSRGDNISGLGRGIIWTLCMAARGFSQKFLKEKVFLGQRGVCLIHGDTISTLLGLFLAKRAGLKVAHIEAGLRSFNYLNPFPEELVRVIAMRGSDMLFAPGPGAFNNLEKMGLSKKAVLISGNTSLESVSYSLKRKPDFSLPWDKFVLVTLHRMENIFSGKKLLLLVELLESISSSLPVVFVQHPPTIRRFERTGLDRRLSKIKNIRFEKILSHAHFIQLLDRCQYVVTDGGSIQEESYYLDTPCLLLRRCTERMEGVGENVCISGFSRKRISAFLSSYKDFRRSSFFSFDVSPSREIVEYIKKVN